MVITVVSGICQKESDQLNEAFIKYVKTKQPFVSIKCASTLDGFIATSQGNSKWITGSKSREFVHKLRHETDAILVGINTLKNDNPSLTTRCTFFGGKDPIRVVLDTNLSIPLSSKLLNLESSAYTIIATKKESSVSKKKQLEEMGIKVITLPEKKVGLDICTLLNILGELKITSLLVEGGSHIISSFILSGLTDKIYMFYAPKIIGGNGIPICSGKGHKLMKDSLNIKNISLNRFDDDIMISGYIDK
jgi:diaminohydroxyphosphoribosylaminopyrimidine deaminase/5-amino-6-(5-phosphoribosylamino)uracil reductase